MGAALPGGARRARPAPGAGRRVGADRGRREGVVRPMSVRHFLHRARHVPVLGLMLLAAAATGAAAPAASAVPAASHAPVASKAAGHTYSTLLPTARFG